MEVRVDDESNVLDAVAVGLELHIDWPVNDLVVGVKEFVCACPLSPDRGRFAIVADRHIGDGREWRSAVGF
jgi:hypothetical protein